MDHDVVIFFDVSNQLFVIINFPFRVDAALQKNLCGTLGNGFSNFLIQFIVRHLVGLFVPRFAVESTESAYCPADVGVIDVAVNKVRHAATVTGFVFGIGKCRQLQKITLCGKVKSLAERVVPGLQACCKDCQVPSTVA